MTWIQQGKNVTIVHNAATTREAERQDSWVTSHTAGAEYDEAQQYPASTPMNSRRRTLEDLPRRQKLPCQAAPYKRVLLDLYCAWIAGRDEISSSFDLSLLVLPLSSTSNDFFDCFLTLIIIQLLSLHQHDAFFLFRCQRFGIDVLGRRR